MHSSLPAAVGVIAMVVLGTFLTLTWRERPNPSTGPCAVVNGPTELAEVEETSGLAVSRRSPNILWSHNDSGNASVLFALDTTGTMRGRVRVPVRTRDWEDISAARCASGPCLYIADIGDNARARRQIQVYRVAEPAQDDKESAPPDVFNAVYADGRHNAEAMFVVGADLYIVTKDRVGGVYRATVADSQNLTFQRISQLGLETVTDAEASPDEKTVVVRTPYEVAFYRSEELARGGHTSYLRIPVKGLQEPQGEGVAVDGDTLYLSSEGGSWSGPGRLLTLRCALPK